MTRRQSTKKRKENQLQKKKKEKRGEGAYTVDFNDAHFMTINPEKKSSKSRSVDNT